MAAIESFARRHPAFTYYVLVFAISWGGILLLVGPGGIPGRPEQVARMMPIALIALFAGPSARRPRVYGVGSRTRGTS